ncbi:MAG: hypothetical protein HYS13_05170 [Planctomycetia bacterium]|nr:hypothetical protein [Planctomycetia bacterium]
MPALFTFNDTIVVALESGVDNEYDAIKGFAKIVRRFISYSLTKHLLFRGAFSIGSYILEENQNLIMGSAVTDAASWYDQPELIGSPGLLLPEQPLPHVLGDGLQPVVLDALAVDRRH